MTSHSITSACFNSNGDWLAVASDKLGQLMVWEWSSETYVMQQQGHYDVMTSIDYSPDGNHIVTGGEDGKVSW